ncbi:MAG: hypothetical protein MJY89_06245 [Bacteroidales bacterium]|nr:hypothetical protein [Bacteroidales bacterium]
MDKFIDEWIHAGAVAEIVGLVGMGIIIAVFFLRETISDFLLNRKRAKKDRRQYEEIMKGVHSDTKSIFDD